MVQDKVNLLISQGASKRMNVETRIAKISPYINAMATGTKFTGEEKQSLNLACGIYVKDGEQVLHSESFVKLAREAEAYAELKGLKIPPKGEIISSAPMGQFNAETSRIFMEQHQGQFEVMVKLTLIGVTIDNLYRITVHS